MPGLRMTRQTLRAFCSSTEAETKAKGTTPKQTLQIVRDEWAKPLDQRSVAPLEVQLRCLIAGLAPAAAVHVKATLHSPEFKQRTQEVFERFDKDNNGVIDIHELPAALMYYDDKAGAQLLRKYFQVTVAKGASDEALDERACSISRFETEQWLHMLDINGSGTVTPQEFDYLARLKFVTAAARLQTVDAMLEFAKYGAAAFALGIVSVVFLRSRRRAAAKRAAAAAQQAAAHADGPAARSSALLSLPFLGSLWGGGEDTHISMEHR